MHFCKVLFLYGFLLPLTTPLPTPPAASPLPLNSSVLACPNSTLLTRCNKLSYSARDQAAKTFPSDSGYPAVLVYGKEKGFVAIKRIKNSNLIFRVLTFTSDHLVNIKDMYLGGDNEIVIVYEQMDISLRHIMAVTEGPLQETEIAVTCQEVKLCAW